MGSANSSKQKQTAGSWAEGGSDNQSFNQSAQGGSSYGQGTTSQGVWGQQAGALNDLYGQAQGLMGGTSAPGQAAQGVAGEARNAWLSQLSPGGNPYFEKSVQGAIDSATQGFTRNVLPELDARGVGMGQYGGAR
ncbi:MAG: hypothetical protein ACRC1H_13080, partial [Caldilineaceae bacterium]